MHTDLDILAIRLDLMHSNASHSHAHIDVTILDYPNAVCRALLLVPETGFPMVRGSGHSIPLHSAAIR